VLETPAEVPKRMNNCTPTANETAVTTQSIAVSTDADHDDLVAAVNHLVTELEELREESEELREQNERLREELDEHRERSARERADIRADVHETKQAVEANESGEEPDSGDSTSPPLRRRNPGCRSRTQPSETV
jgi:hypothetical protein